MMVSRRLEAQQKFFRWLTIAVFGVIVVRLITLQFLEAPLYRTEAALNQFRFLPVRAPRGDIVDSKGICPGIQQDRRHHLHQPAADRPRQT